MRAAVCWRHLAALAIVFSSASCSLGRFDHTTCTSNLECIEAFGTGFSCGDEGFCEAVPLLERCDAAYPDDFLSNPERYPKPFVYGNLMDRSLQTHVARERAARLAAVQINAAGGLDGRTFALLLCTIEDDYKGDGRARTEAAVDTARYLVETYGVPGVIGPASSGDTVAVFEAIRDSGAVVITPSGTSPALFDIDVTMPSDDNPGRLWRTPPPDSVQGAVIASDIIERGAANVAVIHETGPYGEELARVFVTSYQGSGNSTLYPFSEGSDQALADAIRCAGDPGRPGCAGDTPDEVLFISSQTTDAITFLNLASQDASYGDKAIFLTDAAANQDLLVEAAAAQPLFERVRGTRPAPLDPATSFTYAAFVEDYRAEYDDDVTAYSFTAHAFDAAWLMFYATAWADAQEPIERGIAPGLRRLSKPDVADEDKFELRQARWLPAVNAFRNGQSIDVTGVSGELDYDPDTEETVGPIQIWAISTNGSEIIPIETITPGDL